MRRARRQRAPGGRVGESRARRLAPVLAALLIVPAAVGAWVQGSLPPFDSSDPAFAARPAGLDRLQARQPPSSRPTRRSRRTRDWSPRSPGDPTSDGSRPVRSRPAGSYVVMDRAAWSPTSAGPAPPRRDPRLAHGRQSSPCWSTTTSSSCGVRSQARRRTMSAPRIGAARSRLGTGGRRRHPRHRRADRDRGCRPRPAGLGGVLRLRGRRRLARRDPARRGGGWRSRRRRGATRLWSRVPDGRRACAGSHCVRPCP